MSYTVKNYKTKKALKEAFANGTIIEVWQPGPFGPDVSDGTTCLEGPHYSKPHSWYASALIEDGVIKKLLS